MDQHNKIQEEIDAIIALIEARKGLATTPVSTAQPQAITIDHSASKALEAQKKRLDQQELALLGNEDAFLEKVAANKAAEERRLKVLTLSTKAAQDFNQANEKAIKQGSIKAKQASDYHKTSQKYCFLRNLLPNRSRQLMLKSQTK